MSDERLRAAEGEWRRTGDEDAEARWLVERVRVGANRRLHLEWLSFLGDKSSAIALTLLEPRGRGGRKPSVRQRLDAKESSLDARSRALTTEGSLFWYTLVAEDGQASLRALLAAVELTCREGSALASLARVILEPTREAADHSSAYASPAYGHACRFVAHKLVERLEAGDEAFYDARTVAARDVGRVEVIESARRALRAWWIDGEDLARRLAHSRPETG